MEKILSLLGFAKKARMLVTGNNAVLRSILTGEAEIVIVTKDAGSSVHDKFKRICSENDIPFYFFGSQEEFERATGEKNKVIYSVVEAGFANKLKQLISETEEN